VTEVGIVKESKPQSLNAATPIVCKDDGRVVISDKTSVEPLNAVFPSSVRVLGKLHEVNAVHVRKHWFPSLTTPSANVTDSRYTLFALRFQVDVVIVVSVVVISL
jgi:hypothetical protein